jgi:hypothetical protein
MGREILTAVDNQLDKLEQRFQKDFDREFSATRHGGTSGSRDRTSRRTNRDAATAYISRG